MDRSKEPDLWTERFQKFSSLRSLQHAIANLIILVREFKRRRDSKAGGPNPRSEAPKVSSKLKPPTVEEWDQALRVIISATQKAAFSELLQDARTEPELPREVQHSVNKSLKGSQLYHLDPFLDS